MDGTASAASSVRSSVVSSVVGRVPAVEVRAQANRVLVALALLVGLPIVALVGSVRASAGRRVAVAALRALTRACGVRVEVVGGADLDPGGAYVFVPNHRSHVDIPAVLLARPTTRFVAAQELFRIPLLAATMRALDTVPVDRGDRRRSRDQMGSVAATGAGGPLEVVVFADGRIVLPGEAPAPFKTGAFVLAIDTGAAVVPVAVHGAAAVAPPDRRLYVRPGTVRVELLPPVPTTGLTRADRKRLRTQVQSAVDAALTNPDP